MDEVLSVGSPILTTAEAGFIILVLAALNVFSGLRAVLGRILCSWLT